MGPSATAGDVVIDFVPERSDALLVRRRVDAGGREIEADTQKNERIWLVLTDRSFNGDGRYITAAMTKASERLDRTLLADNGELPTLRPDGTRDHSCVDCQQIWTLARERALTRSTANVLPDTHERALKVLSIYLANDDATSRAFFRQGSVQWVRIPRRNQPQQTRTDEAFLRSVSDTLLCEDPASPSHWLFPALTLTNTRFLQPQRGRLEVATFVPLVRVGHQQEDVVTAVRPDGNVEYFAPRYAVPMSFDHGERIGGRPRVLTRPDYGRWHVSAETIRLTLTRLLTRFR